MRNDIERTLRSARLGAAFMKPDFAGEAKASIERAEAIITAAPDMLAALRDMLRIYPYTECATTIAAKTAIAKAEGKEETK